MSFMTLKTAGRMVGQAAETQTCLNDKLRAAMTVASRAALGADENHEVEALKDLINHIWIHGAYENCGYRKMCPEQRALYDSLLAEWSIDEEA